MGRVAKITGRPELYISIRARIGNGSFISARIGSPVMDTLRDGTFAALPETPEKMPVFTKGGKKNNFCSQRVGGKGREGTRKIFVSSCPRVHPLLPAKYHVAARLLRGYFATRLFISGNKLQHFLGKFRLRRLRGNFGSRAYTRLRIRTSNIYTEKENPLRRAENLAG